MYVLLNRFSLKTTKSTLSGLFVLLSKVGLLIVTYVIGALALCILLTIIFHTFDEKYLSNLLKVYSNLYFIIHLKLKKWKQVALK